MAVVPFDAHHPFTSLYACGKDLLARIAEHREQRREVRRLADVLCSMNSRELNDLAISRSEVDAVARGTHRHSHRR